jgi:1,4-alpha-glucan branching enzyme
MQIKIGEQQMQPRHTEPGTIERPAPVPKGRGTPPGAAEKMAAEKPKVEKPKEQKEKSKEKTVEFHVSMPQARSVAVVGTFNDWDVKRTPMQKDSAGWKATIALAPGRYEYRFVADGQWLSDPNAKESVGNDFGSTNSVLVV